MSAILAAAVLASAMGAAGCREGRSGQETDLAKILKPGAASGFNVVLVVFDTTRQDALGCYGYAHAETPTIDSLAARGVRFGHAVTSVPLTLPSHAALLTGLYPPRNGVRNNGTYKLTSDHGTLAESLKRHGYDTAAFVSSFVLERRFGLAQGFDVYDDDVNRSKFDESCLDCNERSAEAVTNAAVSWLRQRKNDGSNKPFFLWVHYYDPHTPFDSPFVKLPRFEGRPYDAEIAYADLHLKRLVEEIDAGGLRDRTLIVFATDHGEALGEHGEPNHGMFLYGCTTRVALVFSCPALFDKGYLVSNRVVGLVDVKPTLEDLLGFEPAACDGASLVRTAPDSKRAIYMETMVPLYTAGWSPLYALRRQSDKFVLAPKPEYYNLDADPRETTNRSGQAPAASELRRQLEDLLTHFAQTENHSGERVLSGDEAERLAALGYLAHDGPAPAGELPDPKDMVEVYAAAVKATQLYAAGRYREALGFAEKAAAASDTFATAQQVLANIYVALGRDDDAVRALRKSADANPTLFGLESLARELIRMRRFEQATEALDEAGKMDPDNGNIAILRGDCLAAQGKADEAARLYHQALEQDGNRVGDVAKERLRRLQSR